MISVELSPYLRDMFLPPPLLARLEPVVSGRQDAPVLVTGWGAGRLTAAELDRLPSLRLVAHTGAAVGFLVSDALFERGIKVSQTGAAMAPAVAEVSLAFTLALLHQTHRFSHGLHAEQEWSAVLASARPRVELSGCVVGVVGASRTGRAYLAMLRALGAVPLLSDPTVSYGEAAALGASPVPLEELLARSRVVALHAPAIPATRHLLGRRELALMPDGAGLVNTARSWLVDQEALLAELSSGRLDAALDVFDEEPLPRDSPLRSLPNVLLTPHQAAGTLEARWRQGEIVVTEIERFLAGEPLQHEITKSALQWTA